MSSSSKFWNKFAQRYAKTPVKNEAAYAHKLQRTQSYLTADSRVLEMGCGTGTTALKLAPHAQHITGTDSATAMIAIAEEKKQDQGIENVDFQALDVSSALSQTGPVDMVMTMSLLHLLADRQQAIQGIYDKLESGGYFVSSTACLKGAFPLLGGLFRVGNFLGLLPYIASFSAAQLKAEFEAIGFEVLEDFQPSKTEAIFMICKKP